MATKKIIVAEIFGSWSTIYS